MNHNKDGFEFVIELDSSVLCTILTALLRVQYEQFEAGVAVQPRVLLPSCDPFNLNQSGLQVIHQSS